MAGWTTKSLGDLCHIVGGGTPPKDRLDYYNGDIPWATVRDMRSEVIGDTEFKITLAAVDASATNVIPAGSAVIATRVGLGKVCRIEKPTAINQDLRGVFPRDPQQLDAKYLFWWLKSVAHLIQKEGTGATVQGVKLPFVKSLGLPLPPLAQQRRIVAILDEAFEAIAIAKANAEKNLRNARMLFDGYLRDVFRGPKHTWIQTIVEQHVCFIDYRGKTPQKTSEGLRLITAKNVKKGFIQREPLEFVDPGTYLGWMTRGIPKPGDVLFTTEAPLGNVAQLDTAERVVFAQRIIIMQPDPTVLDSAFLKYLLLSEPMQVKLNAQATGATAQGIKASLLKRIPISFPSTIGEQVAIVDRLDSLAKEASRLDGLYEKQVAALDELRRLSYTSLQRRSLASKHQTKDC